ncbi:MAG: hypothetical protein N4A33_03840 [Bacteriovoracaceae bacterium]|jgi:hypothetical protein|nr:hypothetical protein [Bacteriovoracaceae bacterium]
MKLIVSLLVMLNVAFAGRIVPNIKRNMVEPNTSGAAAALSNRNNATLSIGQYDREDENNSSNDYDSDTLALFGNLSNDAFSAEAWILKNEDSDDDKSTAMFLNIGKKMNDQFTLGFTGLFSEFEDKDGNKFGGNTIGFSGNFLLSKEIILGAGFNKSHINGSDLNSTEFYAGAGILKKDKALEATIAHTPVVTEGTASLWGQTELKLEGTLFLNQLQLSPTVSYTKDFLDENGSDEDTVSLTLGAEVEYMLNNNYFIGGNFSRISSEDTDNKNSINDSESSETEFGVFGRLKMEEFQVIVSYSVSNITREYDDNSIEDDESKDTNLAITGSFFF